MKVKIVTFIPAENADTLRKAVGDVGAGQIGEYSHCSFTTIGIGRFTPSENANPHIGEANKPEEVQEERVEVVCDRSIAKEVIRVMREVHPYEEVAFDIYPLVDESDL